MGDVVQKRAVFYLSGYDLRGPRYYHNLYVKEAAEQSLLKDYEIEVSSRKKVAPMTYKWDIDFRRQGRSTQTRYHYLDYSSLIKKSWPRSTFAILKDVVQSYSTLFGKGMLQRLYPIHWPMYVVSILPLVALLFNVLVSILGGLWAYNLILEFLGGFASILGVLVSMGIMYLGTFLDKKVNHYWMIRAVSFVALMRYVDAPDSEEVLQTFSDRIQETLEKEEFDEVLIVCHSIGSVIGVDVASRLVESIDHPKTELITLGGCVTCVLMNPKASDFRDKTRKVMAQTKVRWTDAGAWADGACMCGVHPQQVLPEAISHQPHMARVKFHKDFSPASYRKLKKDRLRLHFQYILSNEGNDRFDYFAMTAGDQYFQPETYLYL